MKRFNSIMFSTLAIISLASCEMKNEIWGDTTGKREKGTLELGVSVKEPTSQTRAIIQVTDFPVTIEGTSTEVADVKKEYASVSEIPANLSLPVGDYTVASHTPGELQKKMAAPYYSGSLNMKISKNVTTEANVICKMKNSHIRLKYGEDFKNSFQSWNITIDDGSNTAMAFDQNDTAPAPIYWTFDENTVEAISVNIRAVTVAGNSVSESRTFKKSDAAEKYDDVTKFFNGGDALDIEMGTIESSMGQVNGITVTTSITFENHDETVEIPMSGEGGGDEPGEGAPSLTCIGKKTNSEGVAEGNVFETGVEYSIEAENWPTTNIVISTPAKLKSLKVTIVGGNEGFQGVCDDMGFTDRELVGDTELGDMLSGLGVNLPMPTANSTNYTFPVGTFYPMMNIYGPTVDADEMDGYKPDGRESHVFQITVEDEAGQKASANLSVTIKK